MLKLKLIDNGKIIAEKKSENIDDFDNIMQDLKIKYGGKRGN